jgi:hypothetical protein
METQELTIIEKSVNVIKTGGQVLQNNTQIASTAIRIGEKILADIATAGGINSPELDERANNFIARCNQRKSEMNEDRKAITQIMDEIKKAFTEQENLLDVKKDGTVAARLQTERNSYAKRVAEEAQAKVLEADRQAKLQMERVEVKAKMDSDLNRYFEDYLLEKKQAITKQFNEVTLETFVKFSDKLKSFEPFYKNEHLLAFKSSVKSYTLNEAEMNALRESSMAGKYGEFNKRLTDELTALKNDTLDKLTSKQAELHEQAKALYEATQAEIKRQAEIAQANGAKKKQLEAQAVIDKQKEDQRLADLKAEQIEREQQADAKLKEEAAEASRQAEINTQLQKDAELTQALFDKEFGTQMETTAPETRTGFNLNITHQVGYAQVFAFWWEHEGQKLALDKIANTKLSQMVTFCEKYAHKTGVKISSDYVKYENDYTAINRAKKAA